MQGSSVRPRDNGRPTFQAPRWHADAACIIAVAVFGALWALLREVAGYSTFGATAVLTLPYVLTVWLIIRARRRGV